MKDFLAAYQACPFSFVSALRCSVSWPFPYRSYRTTASSEDILALVHLLSFIPSLRIYLGTSSVQLGETQLRQGSMRISPAYSGRT